MRWFKAWTGLVLIALLATGCIRFEGNITINDDGSGTVELLSALDSESVLGSLAEFDLPESEVGGADQLCEEFTTDQDTSGFPADAQVTPYEEDGFCGARVTFDLAPSTDHSATIAQALDGEEVRLFRQGENWIFETTLDLGEELDTEGVPPGLADSLFEGASFKFVVDLPGRAIDGQNNATSVGSDGRFEWDIDLLNPPARLFAQTEPGSGGGDGGGGGIGLILIIAAVVLLAAAAAWWFLTQRNKDAGSSTPPLGSGGSAPAAAAPPGAATAPPAVAPDQAVKPSDPQAQRTVAMPAASATPATPEPVWDASLNAWVIDDPVQGRLVHDAATDSWRPA